MALFVCFSYLEKLTACLSCGGHYRVFPANFNNVTDYFFTYHCVVVFILNIRGVGKCSLAYYKSNLLAFGKDSFKTIHSGSNFLIGSLFTDDKGSNVHIFKQLYCDLTLIYVLWLVMNTGFTSPTNNENHWDSVYLIIEQAGNRVYDITLAAVLHIYNRYLSGSEVIACRKGGTVTLVCSDHMVLLVDTVCIHKVIAQCFELAVGNARIKICSKYFNKFLYFHFMNTSVVFLIFRIKSRKLCD